MAKRAQKYTNLKPTNLKYLYEVAAIPKETREEFLQILLKRKNASNQKNVQLIKIIYHYIETKMIDWDDEYICSVLKISKNMLYCHKSRLLKNLRIYFFKWKEIEKREFLDKSLSKDEFSLAFAKAQMMEKIGMRIEAKYLFKKIEHSLTNKTNKKIKENLLLFNTYYHLCIYYEQRKKLNEFNIYYALMETLGKKLIKTDYALYSEIMVKLYYCSSFKPNFFSDKTKPLSTTVHYLNLALKEARKIKNGEQLLVILYKLAKATYSAGKFKKCIYYINLGLPKSEKIQSKEMYLAFKSLLDAIAFQPGGYKREKDLINLKDILNNFYQTDCSSFWKIKILLNLTVLSSMLEDNDTFNKLLYEYNKYEIIYNGLNSSFKGLYFMKFSHYSDNIKIINIREDNIINQKYLTIETVDPFYINKLDDAVFELTISSNKIRNIVFRKEFFEFMLLADFWKGKSCSFDYSQHIMKQIDWINRTRPGIKDYNKALIDNVFFGINLMSDSKKIKRDEFLNRYEEKFKYFADWIIDNYSNNYLEYYYMLSFIAEQSSYQELKDIAKNTFFRLQSKYTDSINNAIKETETKMNEKENAGINNSLLDLKIKAA